MAARAPAAAASQRRFLVTYGVLVVVRVLLALVTLSYVHPDEFFQSVEVMSGDVLGVRVERPWEFTSQDPARSVVFPAVVAGAPFLLLRTVSTALRDVFGVLMSRSPYLAFAAPRVAMLLASFVLDVCLLRVCRLCGFPARRLLLLMASSWPMLVLQTHTFSNSAESVLLCLALLLVVDWRPAAGPFLLGLLTGVGFFVRVTFPLFVLPVVAYVVYDQDQLQTARMIAIREQIRRARPPTDEAMFGHVPREPVMTATVAPKLRLVRATRMLLEVAMGFLLMGVVLVIVDSIYFGSFVVLERHGFLQVRDWARLLNPLQWPGFTVRGGLVNTPLNNILYNASVKNLTEHGLHPFFTHFLVNVPLLFGPFLGWQVWKVLFGGSGQATAIIRDCFPKVPARVYPGRRAAVPVEPGAVLAMLLGCIAVPLVGLSLIPHQEPRFLLPMLVPVIVSLGHYTVGGPVYERVHSLSFTVLFNSIMTVTMGIAHQGGLLRALLRVYSLMAVSASPNAALTTTATASTPHALIEQRAHVYTYFTYMPPRSLLGDVSRRVTVHELEGAPGHMFETMATQMDKEAKSARGRSRHLLLVPRSVRFTIPDGFPAELTLKDSFFPHLSFERLPLATALLSKLDELSLDLYEATPTHSSGTGK